MLSAVGVSALPVTEVVAADVDELSRHSRDDSSTRSSSCESIDSFDCSPCQVVNIGECDVGCQTIELEPSVGANELAALAFACRTDRLHMNDVAAVACQTDRLHKNDGVACQTDRLHMIDAVEVACQSVATSIPCQVVHIGECDVGCQTSAPECDESAACQTDVTMMNHMLVSVHDWRLLPSSTHMVDASSQTDSLVCFDQAEFAAVEKQFVGAMKDAAAKNSELAGALAKYEEIADRQAETIAQLSVAKPSHQASQMPHIARVQRLTAPRRSKR